MNDIRRVPQGTCGLKSKHPTCWIKMARSGPARDLWIEISVGWWAVDEEDRSGPARDLWIEMLNRRYTK